MRIVRDLRHLRLIERRAEGRFSVNHGQREGSKVDSSLRPRVTLASKRLERFWSSPPCWTGQLPRNEPADRVNSPYRRRLRVAPLRAPLGEIALGETGGKVSVSALNRLAWASCSSVGSTIMRIRRHALAARSRAWYARAPGSNPYPRSRRFSGVKLVYRLTNGESRYSWSTRVSRCSDERCP